MNHEKLSKKFHNYDFFILTSNYEGNPKTILEAMSSMLPVIATSVVGIKEIIKDGKNGFLINLKEGSLLQKINQIKKRKYNLEKIKKNARKYVVNNNSIYLVAKKENNIYKKLI